MIEQQYSITRTRATWKPRVAANDLPFVKDSAGNVLVALNGDAEASYTGTGRTLVGQPPYTCLNDDAGTENEHMTFVDADELPEGVVGIGNGGRTVGDGEDIAEVVIGIGIGPVVV